nr:Glycosyltransferase WbsX [uncultured bacterium]
MRLAAGWIGGLALLAGLGVGTGGVAARPAPVVDGPKLVLAFFYCWYGPTSFDQGQMSDRPAPPYISDHDDVIDRQIRQAQQAGIDAFIYSWMGQGDVTANNFPKVLAAAQARDFKLTLYFEVDAALRRGDMAQQLRDLITKYSDHPAFLRWNGKPVLFFWRPEAYGDPAAWRRLRQQIDPDSALLWSVDTVNANYLDAFDTIHFFSAGKWRADTDVGAVHKQWRAVTDRYNRDHGTQRRWVAGIIPGWDESRVRPARPNAKVFPRQDGRMYETAWQAAIDSNPELVTITSWNEWFEGTQIEPSATYGNLYLDLTRTWVARYKGQTLPPLPAPQLSPNQCEVMNGYRVCGKFLEYWKQHGGLGQLGYPISDERVEPSLTDGGKRYTVQYFERAVLELHPENAPPYDVLLTQLGAYRYQCKYPGGAPNQRDGAGQPLAFGETGHSVSGKFREYWEQHGGLAQQGYPISGEFEEVSDLDPGKSYTVQYFERAVFEYHPENAGTPYEVLLAQLGAYHRDGTLCPAAAAAGVPAAGCRLAQRALLRLGDPGL